MEVAYEDEKVLERLGELKDLEDDRMEARSDGELTLLNERIQYVDKTFRRREENLRIYISRTVNKYIKPLDVVLTVSERGLKSKRERGKYKFYPHIECAYIHYCPANELASSRK